MSMPRTPSPAVPTTRSLATCLRSTCLLSTCLLAALAMTGCDDAGDPADPPTNGTAQGAGGNPAVVPREKKIRLGTWNLEHFGQRDLFNSRPGDLPNRTEEQVAAIAEFIRDMAVDVLAVQEIGGPAAMNTLARHMGDDYRFTLGTTGGYDKTMISVGFLFNRKRVELLQSEEMLDFPRKVGELSVFHRKPVNAVFKVLGDDGFDFRAITVHLKAGTAERDPRNVEKRKMEVKILREYLSDLRASPEEDQDIVVLGDFNHTFGDPAHEVFGADGFVEYVPNPNPASLGSPTIVWFPQPIDHIAVMPGIREELIPESRRVHSHLFDFAKDGKDEAAKQSSAWRKTYSDHFPVTVDFDASRDRDPDATFAAPKHELAAQAAK